MDVTVSFSSGKEAAEDFFRFHLTKRSTFRYFYFAVSLLSVFVSLYFLFIRNYELSIFFIFAGITAFAMRPAANSLSIRRIMKKMKPPLVKYTLKFSALGIVYQADHPKEYSWESILEICETDDYLYFYVDRNRAMILVKHQMGQAELETILSMITGLKVPYYRFRFR